MFARLTSVLTVCLVVLGIEGNARATWNLVFTNPVGHGFRSGYFFDEGHGMIGGSAGDGIFETSDGGMSWRSVPLPGADGTITQIRMFSASIGFAAIEALDSSYISLYRTTDGGASWQPFKVTGTATDVYMTSSAIVVTSRLITGSSSLSTNNGASFTNGILNRANGIDFVDDKHGVVTGFQNQRWSYTTNGGVSWQYTLSNPADTTESWSVYAVRGTSTFYTAGEDWVGGPHPRVSFIRKSTDNGVTWSRVSLSPLPVLTTGHLAGFGESMLYIQGDADKTVQQAPGLWRSTDQGKSWINVGGPSNIHDSRFVVLGCRGEIVYAFDQNGNVFKTVDGGNGDFPQFSLPKKGTVTYPPLVVCVPKDTLIRLNNLGCDTIYLVDATPSTAEISALDPSGSIGNFPYVIPPGSSQSILLRVQSDTAGPINGKLILKLRRAGVDTYDTISVLTSVIFQNPLVASGFKLNFDPTPLCSYSDSSIVVSDTGCAFARIIAIKLRNATSFSLVSGAPNDTIQGYEKKAITVRFTPNATGPQTDFLTVDFVVYHDTITLNVPISGIGVADTPKLVTSLDPTPAIQFDTLNECDPAATRTFILSNPSCTALTVSSTSLLDSNQNLVANAPHGVSWTPILKSTAIRGSLTGQADSIRISMTITPDTAGIKKGFIRITYLDENGQPRSMLVPYQAVITRGTRTLEVDASPRDYDTIAFCGERDVTIPIANNGCKPMKLSYLFVSGASFALLAPPPVPTLVPPGGSTNITVRYTPSVSGTSTGSFLFRTDADSAPDRTIALTGFATPTDTVVFKATAAAQSVKVGDTTAIELFSNRTVSTAGINQLDLTLRYNGDIMTPWPATAYTKIPGASVTVFPEQRIGTKIAYLPIRITGSNLRLDSTRAIVGLKFHFTLSDSLSTDFSINRFTINDGNTQFAKCVLGGVTDTGTIVLDLRCGDPILNSFMRGNFSLEDGIAPVLGGAYPNPITSRTPRVSVPYRALRPVDVSIRVVNAEGTVVAVEREHAESAGERTAELDLSKLPAGVYHYQIHPVDGGRRTLTGDIVIVR